MTAVSIDAGVPYGTRLHQIAEAAPDEVALIFVAEDGSERSVTRR